MKLEEIAANPIKFKVERLNKEYEFRHLNLLDHAWIKNEYGNELVTLFRPENMNMEALCRIAFRLLIDKSEFKKQEKTEVNEEGDEVNVSIGGYKLFMTTISSEKEQVGLINALVKTVIVSTPEKEEDSGIKKKNK